MSILVFHSNNPIMHDITAKLANILPTNYLLMIETFS